MNKKLIGIILIIISLLIALALLYFMFFYNPKTVLQTPDIQPATTTPLVTSTPVQPVVILPKPKATKPAQASELSEESARQLAASFAELYGTYSNQGDLSRLKDLKFYVTSQYLNTITKLSRNINNDYAVYSGHKTRAIATQILIMEDARAVMMITTLRTDTAADGTDKSFSQDIKVELVKESDSWKVNNAVWQ